MARIGKTENTNIVTHANRLPVTFMTAVFLLILAFLAVYAVRALGRETVKAYNIGTPQADNTVGSYTGMILREEHVVRADQDGYLRFYAVNGEYLTEGTPILALSASDDISQRLHEMKFDETELSQAGRAAIKNQVTKAIENYDPTDFRAVSLYKANIQATLLRTLEEENGKELFGGTGVTTLSAGEGGFLLSWMDGFEGVSVEELSLRSFDLSGYEKTVKKSGDRVEAEGFLYKVAPDNKFRLCFPLSDTDIRIFGSKTSLTIRTENGEEITGAFSVEEMLYGRKVGVLTFQKYGGNFLSERFLNFRILNKQVTGFKIPETAVVEKSFFVVPSGFITRGGLNDKPGVLVKEGGSARFVTCTVYTRDTEDPANNFIIGEDVVYITGGGLKGGDVLIAPGENAGQETTLGMMASVEGVYQVNKGYCVFKPIVRLQSSMDTSYVMVSHRVKGGLSAYDRIVLNGASVEENEIVYE